MVIFSILVWVMSAWAVRERHTTRGLYVLRGRAVHEVFHRAAQCAWVGVHSVMIGGAQIIFSGRRVLRRGTGTRGGTSVLFALILFLMLSFNLFTLSRRRSAFGGL